MDNNPKMKKSTKYLLIGTLVLFLSILGASVAYYLARVQGTLNGRAAGTELAIQVTKLSSNATGDLIPLDNDLETLGKAALGYENNGACVDINGYSVCQIYKITVTNNGSINLTINGTVTLSGQNTPNIDCATMTNATTVANNNSCMGQNVFVSGDTLAANDSNEYFVMVYINNLDEPQYDSGAFNGTVTFTTEDGRKVKGRFTKPFNLVEHIEELYRDAGKSTVTNNEIEYQYATSVNLMKDRLGGTTSSLDNGNIRYYGVTANNYIDIGDKFESNIDNYKKIGFESVEECSEELDCSSNWQDWDYESQEDCEVDVINAVYEEDGYEFNSSHEACYGTTLAGTPILWRIIGVFDGKLRVKRDNSIGSYSFDTSASDVNDGYGINQWGPSGNYTGADLMKLLNPGYEANVDKDYEGNNETVNNSLYWNSGSGYCYAFDEANSRWGVFPCDFTSIGLSEEAKKYVVDQTLYLGGFNTRNIFANEAWTIERGNNVVIPGTTCTGDLCNDTVTRTLTWTGKVGLIYPSDLGYSADFSDDNCKDVLDFSSSTCTEKWMNVGSSYTISPWATSSRGGTGVNERGFDGSEAFTVVMDYGVWPTLLLDSSLLVESGNGSKEHPYVVAY